MCSQLESSIVGLIAVFHSYSGKEGDKYKLSNPEFKNLLQGELVDFLSNCKDPMLVEKMMSDLDEDKDGEIDFQEFVNLVIGLTIHCNDFFVDCENKKSSMESKEDPGSKKV